MCAVVLLLSLFHCSVQVDDIGDITITNDGATILKQIEVEHPAAKVLVDTSDLQDKEVGDGTTSVVILAAELLQRANKLVRDKIHPTNIMAGYRLALKEAVRYIKSNLLIPGNGLSREYLINAAKVRALPVVNVSSLFHVRLFCLVPAADVHVLQDHWRQR